MYSLRQLLPSDKGSGSGSESSILLDLPSSSTNNNTPTPSVVSETMSDVSRKLKSRPKMGGMPLKAYVENRFMSMDKNFKFMSSNGWKCAECLEDIEQGQQLFCHELPHHRKCLKLVLKTLKGEFSLVADTIKISFKFELFIILFFL